jgi:outer membrane protein
MMLLSLVAMAAFAAPVDYDQALSEALQANFAILGAAADLESAESALFAARGVWDPVLTAGLGANLSRDQSLSQGALVTSDVRGFSWDMGISQALPTGTGWSVDWRNSNGPYKYAINLAGQDFVVEGDQYRSTLAVGVTQQVLKGARLNYNLQAIDGSRRGVVQAQVGQLVARQEVLSSTAIAYWDLVQGVNARDTARQSLEVAREEARIVQAQVDAGNMAQVERTRVAAAVAQAELALIQAENAAAIASDALAIFLGRPPGKTMEPTTQPGDVPEIALDVETAIADALANNPMLHALQLAVEAAEANLGYSTHARLPGLALTGSAGVSGYEIDQGYVPAIKELAGGSLPQLYLGATYTQTLGNRAARGDIDAKSVALLKAEQKLEANRRTVAQQVAAQVRTLETARRQIELAVLNLDLGEQTLAAEKALQAAGRAIEKDILEAQRSRDLAAVEVVTARTEFRKAWVRLQALQGTL